MAYHTVKAGECVSSIADRYGHFPRTIWNAPENAELKTLRKDQSVLLAGDRVFIPELRATEVESKPNARHRFRRHGVPSKIEIQFIEAAGEPMSGRKYRLEIDGRPVEGATDADGWLIEFVPPRAAEGKLVFETGEEQILKLGYLDPVDTIGGLQDRLRNLGYPCGGDARDELGPGTRAAVRAYRADIGLSIPEEPDSAVLDETRSKLKQQHYI